jgi:hypothetical protein
MTIVLRPGQSCDDPAIFETTACPGCGGWLRRWGWARVRAVREDGVERHFQPRRVRCADCRVTHVVLPPDVLIRRRDAVAVLAEAWRCFAAGAGARSVARQLKVPMETVRRWRRRLLAIGPNRYGAGSGTPQDALSRGFSSEVERAARAGWREPADVWRFVAFSPSTTLGSGTARWPR